MPCAKHAVCGGGAPGSTGAARAHRRRVPPRVASCVPAVHHGDDVVEPVEEDDGPLAQAEEDGVYELGDLGEAEEEEPVGAGPVPERPVADGGRQRFALQRRGGKQWDGVVRAHDAECGQCAIPEDERNAQAWGLVEPLHHLAQHPDDGHVGSRTNSHESVVLPHPVRALLEPEGARVRVGLRKTLEEPVP